MPLLENPSEICQMIVDYLKAGAATIAVPAKDILYGDRTALVDYPAITVEIADNPRDVRFTGQVKHSYAGYIMVYYGQYDEAEGVKKAADEFGEAVATYLNADPQWRDGLGNQRLIWGWVTRLEPGYARRGSLVYATRITWEAGSQAPLN